jgi:hypothetical protein
VAESGAWEAYVTTEVRIEVPAADGQARAIRVFPGPPLQTSGAYPDPAGRPITVISARGDGGPPGYGGAAAVMGPLRDDITRRGLECWAATCLASGPGPSSPAGEPGVAVPGMSEADALALGARYGQEAVIVVTPASRKVIDCATGRRSITGWVIVAEVALAAEQVEADLEDDLDRRVTSHGPDPRGWAVPVLAESRWDASDENAPVAGEFLLRLGDHYVIYETEGVEWGWDHLDVPDDESAIGAFRAAVGDTGDPEVA